MRIPLAHNRLVQFVILGAAIFLVTPRPRSSRDIAITRDELARLERAEAEKRGPASARDVDERAIEDEILYREALRVGFDKNDAVVRQRLIQKALFLAEELKGASRPPRDDELLAFYTETRPTWRRPPRHHIRQVFMRTRSRLEAMRHDLDDGTADPKAVFAAGEPCPIPGELTASADDLARSLGPSFARAFAAEADGGRRFVGPLASAYGFHLVEVLGAEPGGVATFEEVRDRVREVYLTKRREDAVADFLAKSFERYRITVDGAPIAAITPLRRLAFRVEDSGED